MPDSEPNRRGATVAQLKNDIDRGRTLDKVSFPDPGLAPLGTDDEAAGTPPNPELIAEVRREERAVAAAAAVTAGASPRAGHPWLAISLLIGLIAVIVAGTLAILLR